MWYFMCQFNFVYHLKIQLTLPKRFLIYVKFPGKQLHSCAELAISQVWLSH